MAFLIKGCILEKPTFAEGNYEKHSCYAENCDNPSCYRLKTDDGLGFRKQYYCEEHEAEAVQMHGFNMESYYTMKSLMANSGSESGRTCKSCGRTFNDVGSGSNSMSVAKSGMCSNCLNNFKSMTGK